MKPVTVPKRKWRERKLEGGEAQQPGIVQTKPVGRQHPAHDVGSDSCGKEHLRSFRSAAASSSNLHTTCKEEPDPPAAAPCQGGRRTAHTGRRGRAASRCLQRPPATGWAATGSATWFTTNLSRLPPFSRMGCNHGCLMIDARKQGES